MGSEEAETNFLYKLLQVPARRKIWELLVMKGPLDLVQIAKEIGLGEMTIRHHIIYLERAGLVKTRKVHGKGPGRPKTLYEAVSTFHYDLTFPQRQYFLMAKHLIEAIIEARGVEEAKELMRNVGSRLANELLERIRKDERGEILSLEGAMEVLRSVLEELGSMPTIEVEGGEKATIIIHNCVYLELARLHPEIVCEYHKSFFGTLAEALGDYEAVFESCMARGDKVCVTIIRRRT